MYSSENNNSGYWDGNPHCIHTMGVHVTTMECGGGACPTINVIYREECLQCVYSP